jgi:CheY-like chemotaxis protein
VKAILFVDDHEVLARLSCEILEMQGYRAVSAYNASDALAKFDKETFDLLVTDFRMDGMNGLELAKKVHEKSPSTPVIIVTGYGPRRERRQRIDRPAKGKPLPRTPGQDQDLPRRPRTQIKRGLKSKLVNRCGKPGSSPALSVQSSWALALSVGTPGFSRVKTSTKDRGL